MSFKVIGKIERDPDLSSLRKTHEFERMKNEGFRNPVKNTDPYDELKKKCKAERKGYYYG